MDPPPTTPLPPSVDLLSSLPEHLQDEIQTRLSLRDAVRTSALSRDWRRRWETLPGLALSFPAGTPASVVDRVLLRYAGPSVSRFASYVKDGSHIDDWLIALSRRRVESISILDQRLEYFTIHSSIFSCDHLVSLSLEYCGIPPFPRPGGFAGFPMLKELYLTSVEFADDGENQLRAMIRASPMLCVLVLDGLEDMGTGDVDWVIEAPNLHTLELASSIPWRFGELPRLQYASIVGPHYLQRGPEFLAGVSTVRELIFKLPLCYCKMDAIPFTFSNLKSLGLWMDISDRQRILFMFCLLRSSPNLEKLKIEAEWSQKDAPQEFLNAQWTDDICAMLQVVEIISYQGWPPLAVIELILSKASLLRTLSVDICSVSQDDRLELDALINCRIASPQAQVLFKVQLEKINFDRVKLAKNTYMA